MDMAPKDCSEVSLKPLSLWDSAPGGAKREMLRTDGSLVLWGGTSTYSFMKVFQNVKQLELLSFTSVRGSVIVLFNDGTVYTEGDAQEAGGSVSTDFPAEVVNVQSISTTHYSYALLKQDGSVSTFGYPYSGGYGSIQGAAASSLTSGVVSIHGNIFAFAALKDDACHLSCWPLFYPSVALQAVESQWVESFIYNIMNVIYSLYI